MTRIVGVNRRL